MSLTKSGVSIECQNCHYISNDDRSSFDVSVPVRDAETGLSGIAKLHCRVSSESHQVEIVEWHDADGRSIEPAEELKQRLHQALDFIAEHRVCGNQKICPADVVRIVESFNHSNH